MAKTKEKNGHPVVKYCPQANEPGGFTPTPTPYPAAVVRVVSPWVLDLDVQGPDGTYRVGNVPMQQTFTPGHYTPPVGAAFPIGITADHDTGDAE
jgi:hypothetical protein